MSTPTPAAAWTRAQLRALPKVELHVHLEGSIGPELAMQLATRRGVELPGASEGVEGLRAAYRYANFQDFIRLYVAISRCLCEAEDFADAVAGVAHAAADEGVRYAEYTFTPMTHVARGVDPERMLEGLAQGRARARAEHGVEIGWVFDVVRSFPDQGMPTVELMLRARAMGEAVVGLGVGGPEGPQWPAAALVPVFARAKAEGFAALPHAGEQDGPASVAAAIDEFGADRIGHGVRVVEEPALLARVAELGIPLELCPSSNLVLGFYPDLAAHPLAALDAAGVKWSINSDDPPLFGTTLTNEYLRCARHYGWDAHRIHAIARAAVEHSYLQASTANEICSAQDDWLRAQLERA